MFQTVNNCHQKEPFMKLGSAFSTLLEQWGTLDNHHKATRDCFRLVCSITMAKYILPSLALDLDWIESKASQRYKEAITYFVRLMVNMSGFGPSDIGSNFRCSGKLSKHSRIKKNFSNDSVFLYSLRAHSLSTQEDVCK